jgi:predicted pyridoxine 5'-phosphate oxidase superfamily flavin-nucleotide-binding protein
MLRIRSQLQKENPRPVFDPETVEFLESGCALIVGTVDADGAPHATRGWSAKVLDPGGDRLRLGLDALDSAALDNLEATGRIAITGANVRTLRSLQMKGRASDIVPAEDSDRERITRYCDAFYTDVYETDGTPRQLLERLTPADFVMCEVTVDESYNQTPGPAAGTVLAPRQR